MKKKKINKYTQLLRNNLRDVVDYPETSYNLLHLIVCARMLDNLLDEDCFLFMAPDDYKNRFRDLVLDIRETFIYLYEDLDRSGIIDLPSLEEDLPF